MTLLKQLQDLEATHGMVAIVASLVHMAENHSYNLDATDQSRAIQWGRIADELTLVILRMRHFPVDVRNMNAKDSGLAAPDDWTDGLSYTPDGTGRVD